ncbi:MAG: adenylosuccinate synthase [Armatimonadetes bacterium]|nr:adenylosuccinate synthase [Armatimonadota bacterium]
MPNTVVVGAQWGDEAKGKVVDYLAERAGMVVRYGGGNNAGHTVTVEGATYKFHLVPCGILHGGVVCVIADGVVVDPEVLVQELHGLAAQGVSVANLRISANAHVIMPYHKEFDRLEEAAKGSSAIGTTGRGIGPAYADKASRIGVRMHDLVDEARLRKALDRVKEQKNAILTRVHGAAALDFEDIAQSYAALGAELRPYVCSTAYLVGEAAASDAGVVFEGAQGALLDLDMGTYPFVTSSHPLAGGACLGTGVGPTRIDAVLGVAKSYTTRVGAGIFPTELEDETGSYIRERGHEYGTTTGRPRRCGWIDTVVLRYSAMVNGLTCLALGHLDVLSGLDTVRLATAYRIDGEVTDKMPVDLVSQVGLTPIYEEMPGWSEDVSGVTRFEDLPEACRAYVRRVEELVGVPVGSVSVGPGREQLIVRTGVFPGA